MTGLCFSLMAGIFHQYYTVALAPAIAALVGMGATMLWRRRRSSMAAALVLSATLMASAVWAYALLIRSTGIYTTLGYGVLVAGGVTALVLPFSRWLGTYASKAVATVGILAVLAGPIAYSVDTVTTAKTGSIVSAGPVGGMGMGGGARGVGGAGSPGGAPPAGTAGAPPTGTAGTTTGATAGTTGQGGAGMGSLLNGSTSPAAVTTLLTADAGSYTWVAAAIGSQSASGLSAGQSAARHGHRRLQRQRPLAHTRPVQGLRRGRADPLLHRRRHRRGGGGGSSSEISNWVAATFTATTVDGVTLYDLTASN